MTAHEARGIWDDDMLWDQVGPALNCGEAEAVGLLMVLAGADIFRVAELIVDLHGRSDDGGDWHHVDDTQEGGS